MGMFANRMLLEGIDKILRSRTDINRFVEEYKSTPGAILVDVREMDEFASGHIPGAVNLPLSVIGQCDLPKEAPLYVYCLRGSRSKRAVSILAEMGYDARSIGGIKHFKGALEK